jgi:hypothetical protein
MLFVVRLGMLLPHLHSQHLTNNLKRVFVYHKVLVVCIQHIRQDGGVTEDHLDSSTEFLQCERVSIIICIYTSVSHCSS